MIRRLLKKNRSSVPLVVGCLLMVIHGCSTGALQNATSSDQKCRLLIEWANRFGKEYPDALVSTRSGIQLRMAASLNVKALNLYRDEFFVPLFGLPYDEHRRDPRRLNLFKSPLSRCGSYPEWQTYRELALGVIDGAIPGASYGDRIEPEQIERSVISDRLRSRWKAKVMREIQTLSLTEAGYAQIEEWSKEGSRDLADFWPSEQRAFFEALREGRKRLAGTALQARMGKLIAAPPTYETVLALEKLLNRSDALFAAAPEAIAITQRKRGEGALYKGLTTLWEQERAAFNARGQGLRGLEQGAVWYSAFEKKYLQVFEHNPVIQEIESYIQSSRSHDFEQSRLLLTGEINRAETPQQVAAMLDRYFVLDMDAPFRKEFHGIEAAKAQALQFEQDRWKYSTGEIALMAHPPEIIVPRMYNPPTEEEIRLSILRAYVQTGGEWIDKTTVKPNLSRLVKMMPIPLTVHSVDLLGCSEFSNGYHCRYRPRIRMDLPNRTDAMDRGTAAGEAVMRLLDGIQTLDQPTIQEEDFALTPQGWRSPSLELKTQLLMRMPWDIFPSK